MDKTVHKLIRIMDMRFIALPGIAFLYCLILFFLHVDQLFIFISVFVMASASVIAVYYDCGYRIRNRLAYLATEAMDAELLKEEANHAYPKSGGSWKTRYGRLYYETIYYNLLGDHEKALEVWKSLPTPNELLRNSKECGLMQLLIRSGHMEEAELYLENVQRIIKTDKRIAMAYSRVIGAYYAAKGDGEAGGEYLSQAYARAKYRSEKIGILYDLGVLAEKLGNQNEAIDYYCQAAGLGPKTWLGQEAARRAEALQHVQYQAEEKALQDLIGGLEMPLDGQAKNIQTSIM